MGSVPGIPVVEEAGEIDTYINKIDHSKANDTDDNKFEPETDDVVSGGFDAIYLEDAKLEGNVQQ